MAQFGGFLIYLAAVCSVLSGVFYFLAWRGREQYVSLARNFFKLTAISATAAIASLLYLIITHDFSVAYVYAYSSLDLPFYYLIASLWGGQEGTFLLWLFYTVVLGVIMMYTARQFERGNMFFLNLFVLSLLLIMIKKSPFELSPVFRADGAGLNPLLQNFWMTIHPPIMFIGFATAVFPFTFALTALVERKYHVWAEAARRWTLFGWATLGVSLVMGGYWAYETLGWGGFWAWDPVENSSLIPWIFLTAQVHSLFIKRQRRGLLRFSLFVVCLTFWSVLYGTFLTRSGVLADFSVHSFVDLGINAFLISGMFTFLIIGAGLLVYRWKDISPEPSYTTVNSRSYLVTLGILILFVGGVLVLLGTSAPLLTRLAEKPSNVGIPYYFSTITPIAIGLLFLIGMFPAFKWSQGLLRPRLLMVGASAAAVTIVLLLISGTTYNPMYILLFGAATWAAVANLYTLYLSYKDGYVRFGYLSHFGLAMGISGAAIANGFETKEQVVMTQNVPVTALGYTLTFTDIADTPKGFDCHVTVTDGNSSFLATLPHEFPKNAEGVMKKPHVENFLSHDLYLAPASFTPPQGDEQGQISLLKGESAKIDKYEITFHEFKVNNHGEMTGSAMSAAARMTITYDGASEEIAPRLDVLGDKVESIMAPFDQQRGSVEILGVRPEEGGVVLKVSGEFVPQMAGQPATVVVEVSRKPLIIMFWLGALITFSGGMGSWVERKRRGRKLESTVQLEDQDQPVAAVTSDAA